MNASADGAARSYGYVGAKSIRERNHGLSTGSIMRSISDLMSLASGTPSTSTITFTYVIDLDGYLRIADRRSEHVRCAGGERVLSAGEITIRFAATPIIAEISNYSTGYCPEPESWPAVRNALDRIPITHPGNFTQSVIFRRCMNCAQINVVKDAWYSCGVCASDLPTAWNCADSNHHSPNP